MFVHRYLGKVGQDLTVGGPGGQGGGGGDPSGVAAHQLQHHHMDGQAGSVQRQLAGGFRRVAGGGAEAGTVIGDVQVVVHGLGNADDLHIQPLGLGKLGDLVAGVHGIVAAVVEEAVDVEFSQGLQNGGIIRVRQLPPAGADGGMAELGNGGSGNVGQINEIPLQNSLCPKPGGVDLIHLAAFPGGLHNALEGGIDDRGRAAAVGDQNVDSHIRYLAPIRFRPCGSARPSRPE